MPPPPALLVGEQSWRERFSSRASIATQRCNARVTAIAPDGHGFLVSAVERPNIDTARLEVVSPNGRPRRANQAGRLTNGPRRDIEITVELLPAHPIPLRFEADSGSIRRAVSKASFVAIVVQEPLRAPTASVFSPLPLAALSDSARGSAVDTRSSCLIFQWSRRQPRFGLAFGV